MSTTEDSSDQRRVDPAAPVDRFVARHGKQTLETVLEKLDVFLGEHKLGMLDETLKAAPIFGNLLGRSRKQMYHALEAIESDEHTWMILTFNPDLEDNNKRKDCFAVRSVIGDCGPITVSFADQLGSRRTR